MQATDIAVRYYNVRSSVAVLSGDVRALHAAHASWLAAARELSTGAVIGVHYNGAKFFSGLGCHDEARAQIEAGLRLSREVRGRHAEECTQATAALCYVAAGDLRAARAALDAVPATTDNRVNLIFASAAGTLVAAYTGDDALAATWFDACEAAITPAPEIEAGAGFAELMVRRGRVRDRDHGVALSPEERDGGQRGEVTSAVEHDAVLRSFDYLEKKEGFEVTRLPVNAEGRVAPDDLKKAIRADTTLVSIMAANNEIGTIQPVAQLGAI